MQDPPAGEDRADEVAVPPVTLAATPSTTAAAPTTTAMPSVATTQVTTITAVPTATAAEAVTEPAKDAKSKKSKNWKLKRARRVEPEKMDSASLQGAPGIDHPRDPSAWAGEEERAMDEPEETASKGVESTAVPPPPPSPEQEPAATVGKTSTVVDESVQAVADLLVAEGLAGPPSNISMPGRSAPTSSGGGTPQYFDLSGQKVMPTRHEDRARDLFHGKVTPIMLQVETISAVDLPEGRCGEFVLDHAHLHLLDRIQCWCDKDVSDDHPEVTRTEQPDSTWSFMVDGVVQLILRALGLPPHTSMIQMGDEGAALSAGVLPAEPPVTVAVTTAADGAPTVTVQAVPEELRSDSQFSRGERRPGTVQDEQVSPEEEPVKKPAEEPVKKTWKRKRETSKKKKAVKTAKKVRKLSLSEDGEATPSPVASGSHEAMGGAAPEQTAAEKDSPRPQSPLLFHDEGLEDTPAEMLDLETEQEAATAREKSQPTPEVQLEEVPMQEEEAVWQENERLEQLHEIQRLATLAQATARQKDQVFMVASDEDLSMDWRPYEEALAEDMESIHKAMSLVKKTQEEVCFSFPDYMSSWVPEEGYAAVVTQQWGTGKSRVNDLPPPASTVVFWYVQLLETVGAVFCMVKWTYAVDPKTKKKDTVCITFAAVHDLTFVHEVEQKQQLIPVHLLVLATDKEQPRNNWLDIDFTQIVPIDTMPIEEGLCFYNPRVPGDDVLHRYAAQEIHQAGAGVPERCSGAGVDGSAVSDCDCWGDVGLQGPSGGAMRSQEEVSCKPETGEGQSDQDGVLPSGRDG